MSQNLGSGLDCGLDYIDWITDSITGNRQHSGALAMTFKTDVGLPKQRDCGLYWLNQIWCLRAECKIVYTWKTACSTESSTCWSFKRLV